MSCENPTYERDHTIPYRRGDFRVQHFRDGDRERLRELMAAGKVKLGYAVPKI